jgi:hypothetical protein
MFHVVREPDYPWSHKKEELAVSIERREFRRVGGTRKIKVNLRVTAASNVNLEECDGVDRVTISEPQRAEVSG